MLQKTTFVINDKTTIAKVQIINDKYFFEYIKKMSIQVETLFINGELFFKFYTDNGIIIVPEGAYLYINISTKKFSVGYDCTFYIIEDNNKICIHNVANAK